MECVKLNEYINIYLAATHVDYKYTSSKEHGYALVSGLGVNF